jgi:hypothetical protein
VNPLRREHRRQQRKKLTLAVPAEWINYIIRKGYCPDKSLCPTKGMRYSTVALADAIQGHILAERRLIGKYQ